MSTEFDSSIEVTLDDSSVMIIQDYEYKPAFRCIS
jgi:hypothetical protein